MSATDNAGAECPHCKPTEGAVNWVPGHIHVGFGVGWRVCVHCDGTQRLPAAPSSGATPFDERQRIAAFVRARGEALRGLATWKAEAFLTLADDIEGEST